MSDTALILILVTVLPLGALWFLLWGPSTESFERMLYLFDSLTGKDAAQAVSLANAVDEYTFGTEGGSMVSYFLVRGSKRLIGPEEAASQADTLNDVLGSLFGSSNGLHTLSFGFRSDPSNARNVIKRMLEPSFNTGHRFGCDPQVLGWIFGDKLNSLATNAVDEVAIVALHSHVRGLSRPEKEKIEVQRLEQAKKAAAAKIPPMDSRVGQSPFGTSHLLMSRHDAACRTFKENMEDRIGLMLDRLTVQQATTHVRRFVDSTHYNPEWFAKVLGSKPGGVELERSQRHADGMMPPPIGRQLLIGPIKAQFGDVEMCKHKGVWYAPLVLEVAPQEDPVPYFSALATSLSGRLPWQMSLELLPTGMSYRKLEAMFVAIMGAAGDHNKQISAGIKELREREAQGDKAMAIRALYCTWGASEAQVTDRLNLLRSVVESWGQSVVTNEVGSPDLAHVAGGPGLSKTFPAPFIPVPMTEAVRLLPLARPASVYDDGQLIAFTREGAPYPIRLGHPELQVFSGTLVFAPTGSGKSFWMNMFNTGALFTPGLVDLPMVTIIDKGPSAKGAVMYAKAVLPPEKASQIEYWRPQPDDIRYAANPMDTHLMCDRPTAEDRDYVISVVASIVPNLGAEGSKFIGAVVDLAYEEFSRGSVRAKKWQYTLSEELSRKLSTVGIHFDEEDPPFVWEVVDAFFAAGMYDEATRAQYHAVPTIPELVRLVGSDRIQSNYAEMPDASGKELATKVFMRNIQTAAKDYGLLCTYTRHASDVRFKVIDLEGLAGSTDSEEGKRRFGVMALFARRLGARNYFLRLQDLERVCPPQALPYHAKRLEGVQEQLKFIEYDELHNMRGVPAAVDRMQKDAREGRKYFVVGILSSQELNDFPRELVNQCTNFFVMGCSNAEEAKHIAERFDLTTSERQAMARELVRQGRFLAMIKTTRGVLTQLLYSRPSSVDKWAFTTRPGDAPLRDALYAAMGARNTLMFLAKHFPSGSAAAEVDKLRSKMGADDMDDDTITRRIIKGLLPQLQEFCGQQQVATPAALLED